MKLLAVATLIGLWALIWALSVAGFIFDVDLRPPPEGAALLLIAFLTAAFFDWTPPNVKRQLPSSCIEYRATTHPCHSCG